MKTTSIFAAVALSFLIVSAFGAKNGPAAIGDPAAPIHVKSWVQGGPVAIKPGQVTVVEFWATWCPPCLTSIPHINKIYKKYADKQVMVVGVGGLNEPEQAVKAFVKKMGKQMTYPVAIGDDAMIEGYMMAYGINTLPHAFVVDAEGKMAWHGSPSGEMDMMDAAIEAAITKRDAVAAKEPEAAVAE